MSVTYDLSDLDLELSEQLAAATESIGLQRCHERAAAALEAAPAALQGQLHYIEGVLHADQGMEPHGHGDHAWLLLVEEADDGSYSDVRVVDPTVMSFFQQHGVPTGLRWELQEEEDADS